jgi:hypothetical protein
VKGVNVAGLDTVAMPKWVWLVILVCGTVVFPSILVEVLKWVSRLAAKVAAFWSTQGFRRRCAAAGSVSVVVAAVAIAPIPTISLTTLTAVFFEAVDSVRRDRMQRASSSLTT